MSILADSELKLCKIIQEGKFNEETLFNHLKNTAKEFKKYRKIIESAQKMLPEPTVALRWHAENPILFSWLRLLLRLILLWVYFCCDFCCEFNFAATFAASLNLLRLLLRVLLRLFYHLYCRLKFCTMCWTRWRSWRKKIILCVYSYPLLLTSSGIETIESNMWQ